MMILLQRCVPLSQFSRKISSKTIYSYVNRNPRCFLDRSKFHTEGRVIHASGSTVVDVSTRESAVNEKLYSCTDVSAAKSIGKILAYRLHECGLDSVFFNHEEYPSNEAVQEFCKALIENGINLTEIDQKDHIKNLGIDYDSLSFKEKRKLYTSLIEELRYTPDWSNLKYPFSLRPKGPQYHKKGKYQVLSKVRNGMIWDTFYHRMIKPDNLAAWQVELSRLRENLAKDEIHRAQRPPLSEEEVEVAVPQKWKFD